MKKIKTNKAAFWCRNKLSRGLTLIEIAVALIFISLAIIAGAEVSRKVLHNQEEELIAQYIKNIQEAVNQYARDRLNRNATSIPWTYYDRMVSVNISELIADGYLNKTDVMAFRTFFYTKNIKLYIYGKSGNSPVNNNNQKIDILTLTTLVLVHHDATLDAIRSVKIAKRLGLSGGVFPINSTEAEAYSVYGAWKIPAEFNGLLNLDRMGGMGTILAYSSNILNNQIDVLEKLDPFARIELVDIMTTEGQGCTYHYNNPDDKDRIDWRPLYKDDFVRVDVIAENTKMIKVEENHSYKDCDDKSSAQRREYTRKYYSNDPTIYIYPEYLPDWVNKARPESRPRSLSACSDHKFNVLLRTIDHQGAYGDHITISGGWNGQSSETFIDDYRNKYRCNDTSNFELKVAVTLRPSRTQIPNNYDVELDIQEVKVRSAGGSGSREYIIPKPIDLNVQSSFTGSSEPADNIWEVLLRKPLPIFSLSLPNAWTRGNYSPILPSVHGDDFRGKFHHIKNLTNVPSGSEVKVHLTLESFGAILPESPYTSNNHCSIKFTALDYPQIQTKRCSFFY